MNGSICITGGSGFVGQQLLAELSSISRESIAIFQHKRPQARPSIFPINIDLKIPDVLDLC